MPWPSVKFVMLGMQRFVGVELDRDDVEGESCRILRNGFRGRRCGIIRDHVGSRVGS